MEDSNEVQRTAIEEKKANKTNEEKGKAGKRESGVNLGGGGSSSHPGYPMSLA
jgi:hypothetical protein